MSDARKDSSSRQIFFFINLHAFSFLNKQGRHLFSNFIQLFYKKTAINKNIDSTQESEHKKKKKTMESSPDF